jgi:iron complex outermembrane recepter protein
MLKTLIMKTAFIAFLGTLSFAAHAMADTQRFNVPAGELLQALEALARQADVDLVYQDEQVRGLRTRGVSGDLSPEDAFTKLLEGTPLQIRRDEASGAILITPTAPRIAASVSEAAESPVLEEIIVTANKRVENVQDVPISVAVIGNQEIERRGLIGMEDYLRSIPGVSQIDTGPSSNAIVIRGITTSPQAENFSSGATVATYFDETPITAAAGLGAGGIDVRPVDLERIEVLRGPQGTAYGSSSLGGTLRMIPAKPRLDSFSARVAAAFSTTSGNGSENNMVQGVVNVPIVRDRFALRAVGYRFDESGIYRNVASSDPTAIARTVNFGLPGYANGVARDDVGQTVSIGGRLAALWQVTDALELSVSHLTQKIEQDGNPLAMVGTFEQALLPVAPQARVRGEPGAVNDADIDLTNLIVKYDLGWGELTSAASWINSGSAVASDLYTRPYPASSTIRSDFESLTLETRVASQLAGRFQFLGGVYYEDVKNEYLQTADWPGAPAPSPVVSNPLLISDQTRDLDQRALFGELAYALTDKLTATVGGRYFKYEKDETRLIEGGLNGLVNGVPRVPIGAGVRTELQADESDTSLKATLSFKPADEALLYASWAEGFRLGRPAPGLSADCDRDGNGLIDNTNVSIESTRTIDSDFLENYEVGGKFAFLDRRILIDSAVYHIDWQGLPILQLASACNLTYTANAGAAESDGIELQARMSITRGLTVDVGGGYTRAKVTETTPTQGWRVGARLPGAPKVNANLGAQYEFQVAGHPAFVRAESFYVGKFYGDLQESPGSLAGDYVKVDARAGLAFRSLSIELFARNLTNEDDFTWRTLSSANNNAFLGYRMRPRTIGIHLGYSFE